MGYRTAGGGAVTSSKMAANSATILDFAQDWE